MPAGRKAGQSQIDYDSHKIAQRLEDARFLIENGEHITRVARRLGVSVDTLEKNFGRDKKGGDG